MPFRKAKIKDWIIPSVDKNAKQLKPNHSFLFVAVNRNAKWYCYSKSTFNFIQYQFLIKLNMPLESSSNLTPSYLPR